LPIQHPYYIFQCLVAVTWSAEVPSDEELYAAETRRTQGWFKGIGYGSFGFSDDDSAEEEAEGNDKQKEASDGANKQSSDVVTEDGAQQDRKQYGGLRQEYQNGNKQNGQRQESGSKSQNQNKEEPVFKDYYFRLQGKQGNDDQNNKPVSEGDKNKNDGYAIVEDSEQFEGYGKYEEIDKERKELEQHLQDYFASLGGSGKEESKDKQKIEGQDKIAFSEAHQISYFPSFLYQQHQVQSKAKNDNKESRPFHYQYYLPLKH
jgi:hypothetical protein